MRTKCLVFFIAMALCLALTGFSSHADARVNVGININIPAFTFSAPPVMAVIPGTYVYFAPDAGIDILFYGGYWYRPYRGYWYRSGSYDGPWVYTAPDRVPGAIIELPPDYRHIYRVYPRRSYGEFHKHWRNWESHGYWERDKHWQEGRGRGHHGERHGEGREHMR